MSESKEKLVRWRILRVGEITRMSDEFLERHTRTPTWRPCHGVGIVNEKGRGHFRRRVTDEITISRAELRRLRRIEHLTRDAVTAGAIDECYLSLLRDALKPLKTKGRK